ncbi:hypothetical protein V2J09_019721 [Rumex salicifolius]
MEINGDGFLEELLSLGKATWESNSLEMNSALFSTNWPGLESFYANQASVSPPPLPPSTLQPSPFNDCFTSVKPDLDCVFNEFYCPVFDQSTHPDLIDHHGSYNNYSMSVVEDEFDQAAFQLDNNDNNNNSMELLQTPATCRLETPQSTQIQASSFNVGLCTERKNKVKRVEGQPSKNLMAERRRRKRLNDRLSMLRSIVPKISKMDRTSILGDTIDYMKELLERISNLQEEIDVSSSEMNEISIFKDQKQNDVLMRNSPKFEVERRNSNTRVEICCSAKPGLLLSTVTTLEALGLEIQQCVISSFNDFSLNAACSEDLEQRTLVSSDEIKQALFGNAGYGGKCL